MRSQVCPGPDARAGTRCDGARPTAARTAPVELQALFTTSLSNRSKRALRQAQQQEQGDVLDQSPPKSGRARPRLRVHERRVDSSIDGPPLRWDYWSPDQPLLDSAPSGAPIV
jgi:hypothetical protein